MAHPGYLSRAELEQAGCIVLGEVLVARGCAFGRSNRLYPGVVIERHQAAAVTIGGGNVFWPGTVIAALSGSVTVGDANTLGPGGCTFTLDAAGQEIVVGSGCRLREGAVLLSGARLGNGAQVLGPVQVTDCVIEAGGDHTEPNPSHRGGVLKGCGRARGVHVPRGAVILGEGRFMQSDLASQLAFHPPVR
jgi:hypothetical protein